MEGFLVIIFDICAIFNYSNPQEELMSPKRLSMVLYLVVGPISATLAINELAHAGWSPFPTRFAAVGAAILFVIIVPELLSFGYTSWYNRRRAKKLKEC